MKKVIKIMSNFLKQLKSQAAFSMLELSVVIGIIGVIVAGGLTVGVYQLEKTAISKNDERIKKVEKALLSYRLGHDRLPCPADIALRVDQNNFGVESSRGADGGTEEGWCSTVTRPTATSNLTANFGPVQPSGNVVAGGLPTKTLGIDDEYAFDVYGRKLVYYVDARMTKDDAFDEHPVDANTNAEPGDDVGEIVILDASGGNRTTQAIYAILSHGANGHGAYSRAGTVLSKDSVNKDEQDNCNCDANANATAFNPQLVQKSLTEDSANALNNFDDVVVFKNRYGFQSGKDDVPMMLEAVAAGEVPACPDGFVQLKSGSIAQRVLGCIQKDLANSAARTNYRDAIEHCYNKYGARLPNYSEIIVANDNSLISDFARGSQYEWLDSLYSSYCNMIRYDEYSTYDRCTGSRHFRCFIPNQSTPAEFASTVTGLYEGWPDAIKCDNVAASGNFLLGSVSDTQVAYFYSGGESQTVIFDAATREYSSHTGSLAGGCNGDSIRDIINEGRAFWFTNQQNYCPSGFSLLEKNSQILGCIQDEAQNATTCSGAASRCWSSFGARLPSYSELTNAAVSTVSISNEEWLNEGTGVDTCGTYDSGDAGSASASLSKDYRCFIPLVNRGFGTEYSNECPDGFVALQNTSDSGIKHTQGCIQVELANDGKTIRADQAPQYCFDNYGARLPTYSELYAAATNNLISNFANGSSSEWLSGALYSSNYMEMIQYNFVMTYGYRSSSYYARCFIPVQPATQEVANSSSGLYQQWPDIIKCNDTSGTVDSYMFIQRDKSGSGTTDISYGVMRSAVTDYVTFDYKTGEQNAGTNTGDCGGANIADILSRGDAFYTVNHKNYCPEDFKIVRDSVRGNTLGCIQSVSESSGSCQQAAQNCMDSFGGRIPSYNEMLIASHNGNITLTNTEWVQGATGTGNCPTILRNENPGEASATSSNRYRCFTTLEKGTKFIRNFYTVDTDMLEDWPDVVMCKNPATSEQRYFYISSRFASTDRVEFHNASSGTNVVFQHSTGAYVAAPAGFDCAIDNWTLEGFTDEKRAFDFRGGKKQDLVCWGWGYYGALFDASNSNSKFPKFANIKNIEKFDLPPYQYTNGGREYTPNVFITKSNKLFLVGTSNNYGTLGLGFTGKPPMMPVQLPGNWVDASTGYLHVCAIDTSGDAYCWGHNPEGGLGDGTKTDKSVPTLVKGGHKWSKIETGYNNTCGITDASALYCWGRGDQGQIGNGSTMDQDEPVLVSAGPWRSVSISSMEYETSTVCAVDINNNGYCWGGNEAGSIGDGTTTNRSTPTLISGGHKWAHISMGSNHDHGNHACGLTTAGDAYCWGRGAYGARGDGTASNSLTPALVSGGHKFTKVNAGYINACGITTEKDLWCWGINHHYYFLGDFTTSTRTRPVKALAAPSGYVEDVDIEQTTCILIEK